MRRPFVILAAAALSASVGAAALAAEAVIQPDQLRADQLIGSAVYDRHDQEIGSIKDLVLRPDGRVSSVVLLYGSTAGIGGKYVAISFSELKIADDHLVLDRTKAQLAGLPAYGLKAAEDSELSPRIVDLGPKTK